MVGCASRTTLTHLTGSTIAHQEKIRGVALHTIEFVLDVMVTGSWAVPTNYAYFLRLRDLAEDRRRSKLSSIRITSAA